MKAAAEQGNEGLGISPYRRLIQQATGAPLGDLALIENTMRDEIFHSTLDWQSEGQLAAAAREAQRRVNNQRETYEFDRTCRRALFGLRRAEAASSECDTEANRIVVEKARTEFETAQRRLFSCLEAAESH